MRLYERVVQCTNTCININSCLRLISSVPAWHHFAGGTNESQALSTPNSSRQPDIAFVASVTFGAAATAAALCFCAHRKLCTGAKNSAGAEEREIGQADSHHALVLTNTPGAVNIPQVQVLVEVDVIWKACDICQKPVRTTWCRCPGCRCSLAM